MSPTKAQAEDPKKEGQSKAGNFWARIDSRHKPSKGVSTEQMRPVLCNAYIRHEKAGSYLYATDSFVLIALPIQMNCPSGDRKRLLPEVALIPEALKALDESKTGRFRIRDGLVEVDGERALFPVPKEDNTPPNFRELLQSATPDKKEPVELAEIGFNPALLNRVAEGLGGTGIHGGVKLRFVGPLRPMRVEPLGGVPGEALLMPIRTGV